MLAMARPAVTGSSHIRSFSQSISPASKAHVGARPIRLPAEVTCQILSTSTLLEDNSTLDSLALRQHATSRLACDTVLQFSGPLGRQTVPLPGGLSASYMGVLDSSHSRAPAATSIAITCSGQPASSELRSRWGLARAQSANAVQGVSKGFAVAVKLVGVGYRANIESGGATTQGAAALVPRSGVPKAESTGGNEGTGGFSAGLSSSSPRGSDRVLVLRLGFPRPVKLAVPSGITCSFPTPSEIILSGQDCHQLGQFAATIRRWRPPEPYNGKGIFVGNEKIIRKEVKKK